MKRMFSLGLMALGLTLCCRQEASAWVNFKFGAGVNWHWQSGANNFMWGLFRDGQVPGPEIFTGYPGGYPGCAGPQSAYLPGNFQYFGAAPGHPGQPAYAGQQQGPAIGAPQTGVPAVPTAAPNTNVGYMPNYYPANNYQPVSYNPQAYPAYPTNYNPYFYAPPNFYNVGFNVGR